jgi:hypothetical protein
MYQFLSAQIGVIWLIPTVLLSTCAGVLIVSLCAINQPDDLDESLRKDGQRLRLLIDTDQALMPEGGQWWVEGPDGCGVSSQDARTAIDQAAIEMWLRKCRNTQPAVKPKANEV